MSVMICVIFGYVVTGTTKDVVHRAEWMQPRRGSHPAVQWEANHQPKW